MFTTEKPKKVYLVKTSRRASGPREHIEAANTAVGFDGSRFPDRYFTTHQLASTYIFETHRRFPNHFNMTIKTLDLYDRLPGEYIKV